MNTCAALIAIASVLSQVPADGNADASHEAARWFAFRSFRPNAETIGRFADIGVNTVCIFPANTDCSVGVPYSPFPPVWFGPEHYDFESLDAHVDLVLSANPNAKLVSLVDLNTPSWWVRLHGRQSGCCDTFYDEGKTLATEVWRKDTKAFLQAFLNHMQTKYGDRMSGYVLACGGTTEWQDISHGEESATRRAAWRKWMTERGQPDPIDIPPASVRDHISHGIFRDPIVDKLAVDYWRFNHWLVGDSILYFAKAAQETLNHQVPVGVFYGYVLEHSRSRLLYEGHLDFDRVFQSDDIDFITAPGSYFDRQIGGGSGYMVTLGSLRYHNKGFLEEIDHRTHTARSTFESGAVVPGHREGFANEEETIAALRREFSMALINGTSLWWFDMFGGWFEPQRVMDALNQMRELWTQYAPASKAPAAEIAMVVDAESMFYVDCESPLLPEFVMAQRGGLNRCGAPYDIISFADLATMDLSRYKLVLLPNLFVVDDAKRKVLDEKVCTGGKTVVWVYAPGVITNGAYDTANVEKLTSIAMETPELTTKTMNGWTSVFAPKPNIPADVLHDLAKNAGVHTYCDAGEPVYANERLLAFHTANGGSRTFTLPHSYARIRESFSGRVVAENAATFTDTLAGPSTVLYSLETE